MSNSGIPLSYATKDVPTRLPGRRQRILYCVSLTLIGLGLGYGTGSPRDGELVGVVVAIGGLLLGMALPLSDCSSQVKP